MTIGEKIKKLRKERGWTLAYLGSLVGISRQAQFQAEKSRQIMTRTAVRYAETFEVSLSEFLKDVDNPRKKEKTDL